MSKEIKFELRLKNTGKMKPVKQVKRTGQRGRWARKHYDPGKGYGGCRLPEASQGLAQRPKGYQSWNGVGVRLSASLLS